jgi:hypothetical protein
MNCSGNCKLSQKKSLACIYFDILDRSPPPSGFPHWPLPWLCPGGPWCIPRNLCVTLFVTTFKLHGPHFTRHGPQVKTESFSLSCLSLPNLAMYLNYDGIVPSHCWGVGDLDMWIYIRYGSCCQRLDDCVFPQISPKSPPNSLEPLLIILNQNLFNVIMWMCERHAL